MGIFDKINRRKISHDTVHLLYLIFNLFGWFGKNPPVLHTMWRKNSHHVSSRGGTQMLVLGDLQPVLLAAFYRQFSDQFEGRFMGRGGRGGRGISRESNSGLIKLWLNTNIFKN